MEESKCHFQVFNTVNNNGKKKEYDRPYLLGDNYLFLFRICLPLAEPDDLGRAVYLYRIGRWDPGRINLTDLLKISYINMDIILRDEDRPLVCGDVVILDFAGSSLAQAAQLQPSLLRRTTQAYEVCIIQGLFYKTRDATKGGEVPGKRKAMACPRHEG